MITVWIVLPFDGGDPVIVCSTEAKAQQYIRKVREVGELWTYLPYEVDAEPEPEPGE